MSLKIYFSTLSLRRTSAPPRKLFWVLGCWVVVCVKADYFPGAGGVGSLRLRPLFVPSIAVPSRPPQVALILSDLPIFSPSLSPSLGIVRRNNEGRGESPKPSRICKLARSIRFAYFDTKDWKIKEPHSPVKTRNCGSDGKQEVSR